MLFTKRDAKSGVFLAAIVIKLGQPDKY
jgi:hypothetical protein